MLSSSSQYIRPVAAFGAGILGDRINSSKVMLLGQIVMVIGMCIVLFMPASAGIIPILIACVLIFSTMYVCQSMHFAIMAEIDCPPEIVGTAIGFICCIGYLPEAICPFVAGAMLDKYPGVAGYRIFFILLTLTIAAGILLTLIWLMIQKGVLLCLLGTKKASSPARKRLLDFYLIISTVLHLRGFCHPPSAGSDLRDHPLHEQQRSAYHKSQCPSCYEEAGL